MTDISVPLATGVDSASGPYLPELLEGADLIFRPGHRSRFLGSVALRRPRSHRPSAGSSGRSATPLGSPVVGSPSERVPVGVTTREQVRSASAPMGPHWI
jgi:hypothetical protein